MIEVSGSLIKFRPKKKWGIKYDYSKKIASRKKKIKPGESEEFEN